MWSVRRPHGRLFQIRSAKASVSAHLLSEEDRRDRRLPSETRWISSGIGIWPHNAWRTRQASLNFTRRRTGSQCNWPITGVMVSWIFLSHGWDESLHGYPRTRQKQPESLCVNMYEESQAATANDHCGARQAGRTLCRRLVTIMYKVWPRDVPNAVHVERRHSPDILNHYSPSRTIKHTHVMMQRECR